MEEKGENKGRSDRDKCEMEKKHEMVYKLTELINNPLKEQMLA